MNTEKAAWEIFKSSTTTNEEFKQEDWDLIINRLKKLEEEYKIEAIVGVCGIGTPRCRFCMGIYRERIIDLYLNNKITNINIDNADNLKDRIERNLQKVEEIHKMLSKINILDASDPHANSFIARPNLRAFSVTPNFTAGNLIAEENSIKELIGTVKGGRFVPFVDFGGKFPRRLTEVQMQEAQSPENQEINLENYEGLVMMVSGNDSGNWVYSAQIVEVGGAIISAIAKKVFG